jgi:hypothetical protein
MELSSIRHKVIPLINIKKVNVNERYRYKWPNIRVELFEKLNFERGFDCVKLGSS